MNNIINDLLHRASAHHQLIKLIVYSLLIINFVLYIRDDWVIAGHTLYDGSTWLDWTRAFAVTIDESAWIILLLLFEMETFLLSDNALSRWQSTVMLAIRLVCYISLGHTLYAYSVYVNELHSAVLIPNVDSLCQLVDQQVSYAYNLKYNELNTENCASLSRASQYYYIDPTTHFIVQDRAGLNIELQLAWVDLIEAVVWLLILATIEISIWLQDRGVGTGAIFKSFATMKYFLYSLLWMAIAYWIYRGHWMFAWDEFVWIAGFIAIELNMVEWRKELIDKEQRY